MYSLLFYDVVDDYLERRKPFREAHLALARAAHDRGELVLAGAYADPADGALFVFRGDAETAARFARNDPYVLEGIVTSWRVRLWNVVVGSET
ncbi:MAG: YciI-like protein [Bacteroidota bacterium]|nr:YciI-like protein [Bacteroidota bacterium]